MLKLIMKQKLPLYFLHPSVSHPPLKNVTNYCCSERKQKESESC